MSLPHFHLRAGTRLVAALVAAALVTLASRSIDSSAIRAVLAFDTAACVYLALAWRLILCANAAETRSRAAMDDPGGGLVFGAVLGASATVIGGSIAVLRRSGVDSLAADVLLGMTVSAAVLAWALAHTTFALRYAHLYYRSPRTDAAPLLFPGAAEPDDLDFAYLAFTIGMTFQVSDVQIVGRRLRRVVLAHSLLSFAYNTILVALVLNLIFSQLQGGGN